MTLILETHQKDLRADQFFIQFLRFLRRRDVQLVFQDLLTALVRAGELTAVTEGVVGLHQVAVGALPAIVTGEDALITRFLHPPPSDHCLPLVTVLLPRSDNV